MSSRLTPALPRKFPFSVKTVAATLAHRHPVRTEYADTDTKGLSLRVSPTGSATYYLLRHVPASGKTERLKLGSATDLSLPAARKQVAKLAGAIAERRSPSRERRQISDALTLQELSEEWATRHGQRLATLKKLEQAFEKHVPARLRNTRACDVTGAEVAALIARMKDTPREANKLLAYLRAIYRKGRAWGLGINRIPTEGVDRYPEQSRSRFLDPTELPKFFDAVDKEPPEFQDYWRLLLSTGLRGRNLRELTYDQIDFTRGVVELPAWASKNRRALTIALAPVAQYVLKARYAAAKRAKKGAVATARVFSIGDDKAYRASWRRIVARSKLRDIRPHDLRRTAGSWLLASGAPLPVIQAALGHLSSQATAVYARTNLDAVRNALSKSTDVLFKFDPLMR